MTKTARMWPTFLVGVSYSVVTGAITPLVPLYAAALGVSPAMVGLVVSSAAVLPLITGVWIGLAVDVLGPRRIVMWAALALGAGAMIIAGAPAVGWVVLGYAVVGLGNMTVTVANQTCVAQASREVDRDRNFGYYTFWVATGMLAGPLLGGLVADSYSFAAAFMLCGLLALVPCLSARWYPRGPMAAGSGPRVLVGLNGAYAAGWRLASRPELMLVLLVALVIIFSWSVKTSFYPLYLRSVGLPATAIGAIFSFQSACSMVVRPLLGTAVARLGRRRVLLGAMTLAALGIGVTPLLRDFWPLALAAGTTGVALGFTQPLTMSLTAEVVGRHERGLAMSLRLTSTRLGQVVSPLVFGALVSLFGLGSAFVLSAAVMASGILAISRFSRAVPDHPISAGGKPARSPAS